MFDDPELVIERATSARTLDGWDSLLHLDLIIALEKRFKIKFATAEISRLADSEQNVGSLLDAIVNKLP